MMYDVIMRFGSLREIETAMMAEVRKLHLVRIKTVPKRSTLADANIRRYEGFFVEVYRRNTFRLIMEGGGPDVKFEKDKKRHL